MNGPTGGWVVQAEQNVNGPVDVVVLGFFALVGWIVYRLPTLAVLTGDDRPWWSNVLVEVGVTGAGIALMTAGAADHMLSPFAADLFLVVGAVMVLAMTGLIYMDRIRKPKQKRRLPAKGKSRSA